MVGLPGTGKTHIAKRICRFVDFFHDIPSQIFNTSEYRRKLFGAKIPASFFDPNNKEALEKRGKACEAALADLIDYMKQDGVRVGVYDATNSLRERRQEVMKILKDAGIKAKKIFLESICDDDEILDENFRKLEVSTPDYKDMDNEEAIADFKERRRHYLSSYKTLDECDGSFIRVVNSKTFEVHGIRGYLPLKVVHFCMHVHTMPRTFYLTRHGQSEYNLYGKIGGDSGLTDFGVEYSRRLAIFAKEEIATEMKINEKGEEKKRPCPARLWTSSLRRTKETAQFIEHNTIHYTWDNGETTDWVQFRPIARRNLDEIYAGTCDGMTYKEIETCFPEEFKRRQEDKLAYRYPRGESYMDVMLRMEPIALELERTRAPLLIICHQGILRILYAYFTGLSREEAPFVKIPLNHVIKLTPHAYGCHEKHICLLKKDDMPGDGQDEPPSSI